MDRDWLKIDALADRFALLALEMRKLNRNANAVACDSMSANLRREAEMLKEAKLKELAAMPERDFDVVVRVDAEALFTGTVKARTQGEAIAIAEEDESLIRGVDWENPDDINYFDERRVTSPDE